MPPASDAVGSRVYLGHCKADGEPAERLATALRDEHEIDVWLADWEIEPGDVVLEKLEEGLAQADVFLVLMSETAVHEAWMKEQYFVMLSRAIARDGTKAIPVRVDGIAEEQLPAFLGTRKAVDVGDVEGIARAIAKHRGQAPRPPRPPRSPVPAEELARYLAKIESLYRELPLAGFETRVRVTIELDELYVPLDAAVERSANPGQVFHFEDEARGHRHQVPLAEAFDEAHAQGKRGVVLLGDPGSGKTTHLKQVLLKVVRDKAASIGLPEGTVPVFLALRNLKDRKGGFPGFIEQELSDPLLEMKTGFGARMCARGRLLFLLDGLDEVVDVGGSVDGPTPMEFKVLTLRYSPVLGALDDAPLLALARDHEVLGVREHFFVVHDVPHLVPEQRRREPLGRVLVGLAMREVHPRVIRFGHQAILAQPKLGLEPHAPARSPCREWRTPTVRPARVSHAKSVTSTRVALTALWLTLHAGCGPTTEPTAAQPAAPESPPAASAPPPAASAPPPATPPPQPDDPPLAQPPPANDRTAEPAPLPTPSAPPAAPAPLSPGTSPVVAGIDLLAALPHVEPKDVTAAFPGYSVEEAHLGSGHDRYRVTKDTKELLFLVVESDRLVQASTDLPEVTVQGVGIDDPFSAVLGLPDIACKYEPGEDGTVSCALPSGWSFVTTIRYIPLDFSPITLAKAKTLTRRKRVHGLVWYPTTAIAADPAG
jgi:TIR domain/NACHT domain